MGHQMENITILSSHDSWYSRIEKNPNTAAATLDPEIIAQDINCSKKKKRKFKISPNLNAKH